ncbi:MAG: hypothetical protein GY868_10130 [Deltaproteobacteria bacterium]|nr:hypothetical protein [Deltaproteobacteria bacterium]
MELIVICALLAAITYCGLWKLVGPITLVMLAAFYITQKRKTARSEQTAGKPAPKVQPASILPPSPAM